MCEKNLNPVFVSVEMFYKGFERNGLKGALMLKFSQVIYIEALFMSNVCNFPVIGNKLEIFKQ